MPDGRLVGESRRKAFVIGLRTAANSLIGFAREVFNSDSNVKYILSFKFSQDHIENLFSKIRARNGFNDNPDVICFKSALRALLVKSDITPSPNSNCIDLSTSDEQNGSFLLTSLPKKQQKNPNEGSDNEDESFDDDTYQETMNLSKPIKDISQYIGRCNI